MASGLDPEFVRVTALKCTWVINIACSPLEAPTTSEAIVRC